MPWTASADPPPDDDPAFYGEKWVTDWTYCEGFAPQDDGCTFQTRFRGFAFPGEPPWPYLHVWCKDLKERPLAAVHAPGLSRSVKLDFRGVIKLEITGENGGWLTREVRCNEVGSGCLVCDSLDGRPDWGRWDRITVKTTVEGVGPWGIGVAIYSSTVPDQPRRLRWKERSSDTIEIAFGQPRAHGTDIRGYRARCKSKGDRATFTSRDAAPRLLLRGLEHGETYRCRVAAVSNKGTGWWSEPLRVGLRR